MSDPNHKSGSTLKAWLDKIQQDSWQLELIISGFVIFLLISAWQPIMELEYDVWLLSDISKNFLLTNIFYYTIRTSYQALLFCLLIHLVLRGLWIAVIGLRYVSGDIEYDTLRYQPRYADWLKRRIGSFDDYIERLERYCSVIFSLAFLILFCFLGLAVYFSFLALIQLLILKFFLDGKSGQQFGLLNNVFGLLFTLFGIIYFIDFISLGFFKRNRYTAKPYFYIYRLMGWVTLARFYRPLYYNLIDHRFGRRLARMLPVFIFGMMVVVSIYVVRFAYFPHYQQEGTQTIDHFNYDDIRGGTLERQTWRVSLKSKYVANNYAEVFVPYRPYFDDPVIEHKYPNLSPAQYVGVKLWGAFSAGERFNASASNDSLLMAMADLHQIRIDDSLRTDIKPRFYYHNQRRQPGLLYMVPAHDLSNGEHKVMLRSQGIREDSLFWYRETSIYFYK